MFVSQNKIWLKYHRCRSGILVSHTVSQHVGFLKYVCGLSYWDEPAVFTQCNTIWDNIIHRGNVVQHNAHQNGAVIVVRWVSQECWP
jgi:hypothetical protein